MKFTYKLPKLADTADNYVIVEWNVEPGSTVSVGDPLVVVETDKTTVQVDATFGGTVLELLAADGDEVVTGQAICVVEGQT